MTSTPMPPSPNTAPQAPVPSVQPPASSPPPVSPHRRLPFFIWIPLILALFFLAFAAGYLGRQQQTQAPASANISPTPELTKPASQRQLNPVATGSAYLDLETGTASLSAKLDKYSVQDQTVSPPVLVLPLGFSNK